MSNLLKNPINRITILFGIITIVLIFTGQAWHEDFKHLFSELFALAILVSVLEWLHEKSSAHEAVKAARGDFLYDNEIYSKSVLESLVSKIGKILDEGKIKSGEDLYWLGSKLTNPFLGATKKIRDILVIHRLSPAEFDIITNSMLKDCMTLERQMLSFYERYYEAIGNNFSIDQSSIPTDRKILENFKKLIVKRLAEDFTSQD